VNKFGFSNGSISVHIYEWFLRTALTSQMVLSWLNIRVADTVRDEATESFIRLFAGVDDHWFNFTYISSLMA